MGSRLPQSGMVARLTQGNRSRLGVLALSAFVGGVAEAAFLVVVTKVAVALADDQSNVALFAGIEQSRPMALLLGIGLLLIRFALSTAEVALSAYMGEVVIAGLRRRAAASFLQSSWALQHDQPAGKLQQLVTGFSGQAGNVINSLTMSIRALVTLVALLVGALFVDPLSMLFALVLLAALGFVLAPVRRRIRARSKTMTREQLVFATAVAELSDLGLEMQSFGVRDQFSAQLDDIIGREARARRKVQFVRSLLGPTYVVLAFSCIVAALAVADNLSSSVELSELGAVVVIMLRSLGYGQQLQTSIGNMTSALPALERVEDAISTYNAKPAAAGAAHPRHVTPIRFHDVHFGYEAGPPVLHGVSFTIEPGEVLGVIGPSGAGKTTLLQLLLGIRTPSKGRIAIDGVDMVEVDRDWWTDRVAFVGQEPKLITGTIAENLRFMRSGISDEALRTAAAQANILTELEELEGGFPDALLGDRGRSLSGGQRQRVSIARALAGQPELLVLDEPTSSLDPRSEELIRETLRGLAGEVTVVIVAHRMSTLEACDRLIAVEHGRTTGPQAPAALREASHFYRSALGP